MMTAMILLNVFAQSGVVDPNKNNGYLILGYGVMWAIALFYVLVLANRQRNIREELHLLRQLLEEDEDSQNK
jgi:CcmD family protein